MQDQEGYTEEVEKYPAILNGTSEWGIKAASKDTSAN